MTYTGWTGHRDGRVVVNLANGAQTLIVDENTQYLQLRGVFSLFDSFRDLINFVRSNEEARVEDGYGILVAAADGDWGREALRIDVQNADGTVADELRLLVEMALEGGADGSETDINLRIGGYELNGPEGSYLDVLVDGGWATDILRITGGLAAELLTTVDGFDLNADPVAADDTFDGVGALPITGNVLADNGNGADSDADDDALTVIAQTLTTANGGRVTLAADGSFTYEPADGFAGEDSFTYTVEDGKGGSDTAIVTLNVPGNAQPVAVDDTFSGRTFLPIEGNVLADNGSGADSDADGDALTVVAGTFATEQGGTVVLAADGSFTYQPAEGFDGEDSFTYTVEDGYGGSGAATVTLNVRGYDEVIVQTDGDQFITGSSGDSYIETGDGNDSILGDYGELEFDSSEAANPVFGDDVIVSAGGDDSIFCDLLALSGSLNGLLEFGDDILIKRGSGFAGMVGDATGVTVNLIGDATIAFGDDVLDGSAVSASGGSFPSVLVGDAATVAFSADSNLGVIRMGSDTIAGTDGNDEIYGDASHVTLQAAGATVTLVNGDDRIEGGGGDDVIYGDTGMVDKEIPSASRLIISLTEFECVSGADTFVFGTDDGLDTIMDFQQGLDTIEISDSALSFDVLDIREENGDSIIDFDGAGADEHQIVVRDVTGLTADDFAFV